MKFLKGTSLYSIFTGTCPVCHEESMYTYKNPFNITKVITMNERCSNCNTKYQMEPSFFYGAMYVSYGVGVAIGVAAFIVANMFLSFNLLNSFLFITVIIVLAFPFIMRISRNIWINLFLNYDSSKSKQSA